MRELKSPMLLFKRLFYLNGPFKGKMTKNKERFVPEDSTGRRSSAHPFWRQNEVYAPAEAQRPRVNLATGDEDQGPQQFQQREAVLAAVRLREETLYVIDLIRVLKSHRSGRRRWAVMQSIRKDRAAAHLPIPENFEHAVESAFQQHCLESGVFNKGRGAKKPALFVWPLGKAGGVWAVDANAAKAWLADNA